MIKDHCVAVHYYSNFDVNIDKILNSSPIKTIEIYWNSIECDRFGYVQFAAEDATLDTLFSYQMNQQYPINGKRRATVQSDLTCESLGIIYQNLIDWFNRLNDGTRRCFHTKKQKLKCNIVRPHSNNF